MRQMMLTILALILVTLSAAEAGARKRQSTTRPRLERREALPVDTLADFIDLPLLDSISFSGYDKPLRSRRETLFVTNSSSRPLRRLVFTLDYSDLRGRQLHSADIDINVDIPAGETRRISFPSWDTQLTFVYRLSARSSRGTPYDVALRLNNAVATPPTKN